MKWSSEKKTTNYVFNEFSQLSCLAYFFTKHHSFDFPANYLPFIYLLPVENKKIHEVFDINHLQELFTLFSIKCILKYGIFSKSLRLKLHF